MGRGRMTAGNGAVAVTYTARTAPAVENATCPCMVFGLSRDQGKPFRLPRDEAAGATIWMSLSDDNGAPGRRLSSPAKRPMPEA
jgi:hypothetical protein